jgi:hypothetical protein
MKCIRCGGCCLHTPCYWAQLQWQIHEQQNPYKAGKVCPALQKEKDGTYTCLHMYLSNDMRREMLGTGCHYPEYRRVLIKEV